MKNVLIYASPDKKFDDETDLLAKIQIDNSLDLGWTSQSILLFTNFPYHYHGVTAIQIPSNLICLFSRPSINTFSVPYLFSHSFIETHECYWVHDFDAYQNNPIGYKELGLTNIDAGFTDYGRSLEWCNGSFFFKAGAQDLFQALRDIAYEKKYHDNLALNYLTSNNINNINSRIKRMNISYNFGMRWVDRCYQKAVKPIKVLHFHLSFRKLDNLAIAMYGENRLSMPLMSHRLINIFQSHGIK